jgi:hypothetical protein
MLGVLAYMAWELVEVEFRLGARTGIRSLATLVAPLLAGGYALAMHRPALDRIGAWPPAVRFAVAFAAGALAMASLHFFLALFPLPLAELAIGSCATLLLFGLAPTRAPGWPLAALGIATGMLGFAALYGLPKIL